MNCFFYFFRFIYLLGNVCLGFWVTKIHLFFRDLSENLIEVLEAYTFAAFPTLTNLNLSYNNLFAIHRDAFIGLTNLKNL